MGAMCETDCVFCLLVRGVLLIVDGFDLQVTLQWHAGV